MPDILGTAGAIIGLISTALTLIRQIDTARDGVRELPQRKRSVSERLDTLVQSLSLVKDERNLQTPGVKCQVEAIIAIAGELRVFYDSLLGKSPISVFFFTFLLGDKGSKQLDVILKRLSDAREELMIRISLTLVGLVGNLNDGFNVAFDVLRETNEKVKEIADGRALVLMDHLQGRAPRQLGEVIPLSQQDIDFLGLSTPEFVVSNVASRVHIDGETGMIDVGGDADDVNTGISIQKSLNQTPRPATNAIIKGKTGSMRIGGKAKGVNTGISVSD
ncbi:hypothetical protein F5Y18DRAFT_195862 [Xylariaceae sp. FL1019]|nr:hypothetical protein F5Y18DRAFT_195862 [Xylariaceae sp. FL1019]